MKNKFEEGKLEFENNNYEKALECFEQVLRNEENDLVEIYKFECLLKLKRYVEALKVIDSLISNCPYSETLWKCKARCHIFLKDNQKALKALGEVERLCDEENKEGLVDIAQIYNLLDEHEKVIKYCDKALAVDKTFKPALYEKVIVASCLKDMKMIDELTEDILSIPGNDLFSLLPIFIMNLFSKRYEKCLEIIDFCELDGSQRQEEELLKGAIYQTLSEDLNAQIGLSKKYDLPVDDAISLMMEFKKTGRDHGVIHGVEYYIL